jgi:methionyl-tRNA synthetase
VLLQKEPLKRLIFVSRCYDKGMYTIAGPHTNLSLSSTQVSLLSFLIVWELIWKGLALWRAGRNKQLAWFIIILIANTLGLLEIMYIFGFQRDKTKINA